MGRKTGRGHVWTLTDKRRKDIIKMLTKQHTIVSIAAHYGVEHKTISRRLSEAGISATEVRNNGLISLRAALFSSVYDISDSDKRIKAGLDFLKQYPIAESTGGSEVVDDDSIAREILDELSS